MEIADNFQQLAKSFQGKLEETTPSAAARDSENVYDRYEDSELAINGDDQVVTTPPSHTSDTISSTADPPRADPDADPDANPGLGVGQCSIDLFFNGCVIFVEQEWLGLGLGLGLG